MANHDGDTQQWWQHEATPGVLLVFATLISFALQNSPIQPLFDSILNQPVQVQFGPWRLQQDLAHFIADGLMALFFLYIGLELKRETIEGPFNNAREAMLPFVAAIGGMVVPALIFVGLTAPADLAYARGWAAPAATDIAFAVGVLALLGKRVPASLRLFLLALAIVDDVGAILVIAVFYSAGVTGWALGGAVVTFLVMLGLNRLGVRRLMPYWLLTLVLWSFMLASGVHATIAGVLAAMAFPMRRANGRSPLIAAEHELQPWVMLGILPIFAIANAGAPLAGFTLSDLAHPVTLGAALGLALGKPIGIMAGALVGARLFKQPLPAPAAALTGVAWIAGIGFTMSLFIGALAYGGTDLAAPMRIGVLTGSFVSALCGLLLLWRQLEAPRGQLAQAKS